MKVPCEIQYRKEVNSDLQDLTDELFDECMLMISKLKKNIHLGQPLEDKNGKNLSGCYKIYFNNAKHRIVYRKLDLRCEIIVVGDVPKPVADVIAIGKRNVQQVYKDAFNRLK